MKTSDYSNTPFVLRTTNPRYEEDVAIYTYNRSRQQFEKVMNLVDMTKQSLYSFHTVVAYDFDKTFLFLDDY
jgi:uncharacterized protein YvpB